MNSSASGVHQAVEEAAQRLRGSQAHVLVSLIDDQLLRLRLGQGKLRELRPDHVDVRLEWVERVRTRR